MYLKICGIVRYHKINKQENELMHMELSILKELGLSDGEIKVYSAILEIGVSTINKIHEKTGIERRNIYDIINKLIEKGFISYVVEKGKRTYQSVHPKLILKKIKEKEDALKTFEKQIPQLIETFESSKPEIRAEVYRGVEGIKAVFEDMLNSKENYFIGGGLYVIKKLPHFWLSYNKRRTQLKVKWYNLARYEMEKERLPNLKLYHQKFLPKEFSGAPVVVFIYGNKIANVLWSGDYFAFVIESKEIAESYKAYHKHLWDNVAKPLSI